MKASAKKKSRHPSRGLIIQQNTDLTNFKNRLKSLITRSESSLGPFSQACAKISGGAGNVEHKAETQGHKEWMCGKQAHYSGNAMGTSNQKQERKCKKNRNAKLTVCYKKKRF